MLTITKYSNQHEKEWNDFLKTSKNGLFMFDRNYMNYHGSRFCDHSLMIYDKDKLIALLPANESGKVLYSHQGLTFGGFITNDSMKISKMLEALLALKEYLLANGCNKLIYKTIPYIYHSHPAEEDVYALFKNKAILFRVDVSAVINLTNKIPFSGTKRKGEGEKKSSRYGVVIKESNDYVAYMKILASVLHEKHKARPTHSSEEMEFLASHFPNNIKLFTAEKDDTILAGVVIFEYTNLVHSQYMATSAEGRNVKALDAILASLINDTYSHKKYFSFGISTENDGNYLNESLMSYKEEFGARSVVHQFFELNLE